MKIDFLAPILDLEQKPIIINDSKGDGKPFVRPFTLRDMAVASLMSLPEDPKSIDGGERQKRTHLADRIFGAAEPIQITVEEAVVLKELINSHYAKKGTLAIGRAWDILDGLTPAEEKENA